MKVMYVYVYGSDLHEQESVLEAAFGRLAHRWSTLGASLVNQRHPRTPDMRSDDLADWDLGINLPVESFGSAQAAELVGFAKSLALQTDREFVVGLRFDSGIAEDVVFLGSQAGEREHKILCEHVALR